MSSSIKKENESFMRIDHEETLILLPHIIENEIPLMRKKKDGTFTFIPPSDFDKYFKESAEDLYINEQVYRRYADVTLDTGTSAANDRSYSESGNIIKTKDSAFITGLKEAGEMDMMERLQSTINSNYQIKTLIDNRSRFNSETASEISNALSRILCISRVTLEENINTPVSEDQMIRLINETVSAVDNLITLLSNGESSYIDLATLEFIQTGSSTLNHMNRMLIRVVSFLSFYNEYFTEYSNEVKRIRAHFKERYLNHYTRLFADPQNINLEIVFKGGIAPVSDRKIFLEYALGGFFHDIGKFPNIEYHDSDEGFVPLKARRHVFDSYNMLLHSGRFTTGTVAMGLLHHDYYNAPYGYRQRDTLVKKFDKRKMDRSDSIRTKYCMSHNIMDVAYGISLSYFPGKILEILDIYDAMTDPDKSYKKSCLTPEEALAEMKQKYLLNGQPGIDPVLFNIFVDFLKKSGVLVNINAIESIKV
jgi:hypothetical protein